MLNMFVAGCCAAVGLYLAGNAIWVILVIKQLQHEITYGDYMMPKVTPKMLEAL